LKFHAGHLASDVVGWRRRLKWLTTRRRDLDATTLRHAMGALTSPETPIVTSTRLKEWFDSEGYDWGGSDKGRKGRLFELADAECTGTGLLSKWKKRGAPNAPVGWSLPGSRAAAERWAAENGWQAVKP
jgi:hypothetical protein